MHVISAEPSLLVPASFFFWSLKAIHQPIRRRDSERNESEMMVPIGSHLWSAGFCQVKCVSGSSVGPRTTET